MTKMDPNGSGCTDEPVEEIVPDPPPVLGFDRSRPIAAM
jgi:hypothetical protein